MLPARSNRGGSASSGGFGAGSSSQSSASASSGPNSGGPRTSKAKMPELDDFLSTGDFTGAVTLLDFQLRTGGSDTTSSSAKTLEWLAYAAFHNQDYKRAAQAYDELATLASDGGNGGNGFGPNQSSSSTSSSSSSNSQQKNAAAAAGSSSSSSSIGYGMAILCKAACLYFLGQYETAEAIANTAPACPLRTRLLLHLAHRLSSSSSTSSSSSSSSSSSAAGGGGGDAAVMKHHANLNEKIKEDSLSKAAMHYSRAHYQEATDIYKRLLLENRDDAALHAYIAACYYRLDYYEVSLEILAVYLQARPFSPSAINLKACNHFKLYNGKAAEAELKALADQGYDIEENVLMKHNLVVFRHGDGASRVFPPLVGIVPEARLNLILYHLRAGNVAEAYAYVKDLEPSTPQEYILTAVVHASIGQRTGNREYLKTAREFFNIVGSSPSECDTIPGREAMASCYFLTRQFEEVNVYLQSIKPFLLNDDGFNWNYGLTLAAIGDYKGGEEALTLVQNRELVTDYIYVSWLARCHIMNRRPRAAWELYLRMDSAQDAPNLLLLIANDCYRTGAFYWAAKSFDVLERMDPDPEYWEGKRGAAAGVLQAVIAGTESREALRDIVGMLRSTNNAQAQYMVGVIERWAAKSGGI